MKKAVLCASMLLTAACVFSGSVKTSTYKSDNGDTLSISGDTKKFGVYNEGASHERADVLNIIAYKDCPYKFVFLDGKALKSDSNFRIFLVDERTGSIKRSYFGDRLSDEDANLAARWMKEQTEIDDANKSALIIVAACAVVSTMIGILAFCLKV